MQVGTRTARTGGPTSADPADWSTGRLLSAAARRMERAWNVHLSAWDLNHASLPVLLHLLGGPRSQRELATSVDVTEQTMSRMLARLERTGLVTRSPHDGDRRRVDVAITSAGCAAALQAADPRPAEQLLTAPLNPTERDELRRLLTLMLRADDDREEA